MKKLRVFVGPEHTHVAQNPIVLDIAAKNPKNKRGEYWSRKKKQRKQQKRQPKPSKQLLKRKCPKLPKNLWKI